MDSTVKQITSKDGTAIGYKKTGSGEGVILIHGAGRIAADYEKLAQALADQYTVYTYDRRGRGNSDAISTDHCIDKECEDLTVLLEETGAEHVFGHSMGGLVALETACRTSIGSIAVYEPPVSVNNSIPEDFIPAFNAALERKQYEKAMVLMMKGLQMHEAAKMPTPLLIAIVKLMRVAKKKGKEWVSAMAETMPTVPTDLAIAKQLDNSYGKYKRIRSLTLLMGGTKSPAYLLRPLELLCGIIPYASTKVFEGFYHVAPEENAIEIASTLKQFFK